MELELTRNVFERNLTHKQNDAIRQGQLQRERMELYISGITRNIPGNTYQDLYIYSKPGLGKTHSVKKYISNDNVKNVSISGDTSMFAFGIQLAVIGYIYRNEQKVIIHIDDCDKLFSTEETINIMKKVLDKDRLFTYGKSLSSQMRSMNELQVEALEYFSNEERMGFQVPTDNMSFIFTSNTQLPIDEDVEKAKKSSRSKAAFLNHLTSIRGRIHVCDFALNKEEHWGWISDVILNTDCLLEFDPTVEEKCEVLNYLWKNWFELKEKSIRLVEKMFSIKRIYIDNYEKVWDFDYLKKKVYEK
jgi:hypothetical protein